MEDTRWVLTGYRVAKLEIDPANAGYGYIKEKSVLVSGLSGEVFNSELAARQWALQGARRTLDYMTKNGYDKNKAVFYNQQLVVDLLTDLYNKAKEGK